MVANTTDSPTFEISFFSDAGAKAGIKTYARCGFERVDARREDESAGGRIWVTFRATTTDPSSL